MNGETFSKGFNLNSIIVSIGTAIILAVLLWIGKTSSDNNDKLNRIETSMPFMREAISDLRNQMANLVSKAELENKLNEIRMERLRFENEVLKASKEQPQPTTKR